MALKEASRVVCAVLSLCCRCGIRRRCPGLTDVDLTRCVLATDAGVMPLALGCAELRRLCLYADSQLTVSRGAWACRRRYLLRNAMMMVCLPGSR